MGSRVLMASIASLSLVVNTAVASPQIVDDVNPIIFETSDSYNNNAIPPGFDGEDNIDSAARIGIQNFSILSRSNNSLSINQELKPSGDFYIGKGGTGTLTIAGNTFDFIIEDASTKTATLSSGNTLLWGTFETTIKDINEKNMVTTISSASIVESGERFSYVTMGTYEDGAVVLPFGDSDFLKDDEITKILLEDNEVQEENITTSDESNTINTIQERKGLQFKHQGNAYSYKLQNNPVANNWSTVVMATSNRKGVEVGYTNIQIWGRLDTLNNHWKDFYKVYLNGAEAKLNVEDSNGYGQYLRIISTTPGTINESYTMSTYSFELIDYIVPGVGYVGKVLQAFSNGVTTSGTTSYRPSYDEAWVTFKKPANLNLPNTISWKNANEAVNGKTSGITAEFNWTLFTNKTVNLISRGRVQYNMVNSEVPLGIKLWTNYAYVKHTVN